MESVCVMTKSNNNVLNLKLDVPKPYYEWNWITKDRTANIYVNSTPVRIYIYTEPRYEGWSLRIYIGTLQRTMGSNKSLNQLKKIIEIVILRLNTVSYPMTDEKKWYNFLVDEIHPELVSKGLIAYARKPRKNKQKNTNVSTPSILEGKIETLNNNLSDLQNTCDVLELKLNDKVSFDDLSKHNNNDELLALRFDVNALNSKLKVIANNMIVHDDYDKLVTKLDKVILENKNLKSELNKQKLLVKEYGSKTNNQNNNSEGNWFNKLFKKTSSN